MDYNFGPSHNRSFLSRAKGFYSNLTPKARAIIGIILLFLVFKYFTRDTSNDLNNNNIQQQQQQHQGVGSTPGAPDSVGANVNELVKDEEIIKTPIHYLGIRKPFFDPNTLNFYNFENGGNMMLHRNEDHVRLVAEKPNSVGYLFSRYPIPVGDADAFQIEVSFRIHGQQTRSAIIGDGMALWISDRPLNQGSVFGMSSEYRGLGFRW
ncbi:unnamed protein product [Ambrosiozyma monospora]|uniref:Unnamed protein product n=1 Tax=Ambrosiozyma monospora TaxID=43982 RepID=A0ACB5TLT7_AMBMO|nr:unnamed protein product [Ambrosiozyma monospora]